MGKSERVVAPSGCGDDRSGADADKRVVEELGIANDRMPLEREHVVDTRDLRELAELVAVHEPKPVHPVRVAEE